MLYKTQILQLISVGPNNRTVEKVVVEQQDVVYDVHNVKLFDSTLGSPLL